jgi:hypothetical protein
LALFAVLIGFASLYAIRGIMLVGSPFGYSLEGLVKYSDGERWADNILDSSGINESVENYPQLNQNTALVLSYDLFPVLIIPLIIGIFLLIKKELWGSGIFVVYILFYYIMFATVLGLRADRHLLSIIALLSPVYIYGLKSITGHFGWSGKSTFGMTIILIVLQLPILDAIYYPDFKIANLFPSMYYWYTTANLVKVLGYSLMTFAIVLALGNKVPAPITRRLRGGYIFGALFGITVFAIIAWPIINILQGYGSYQDYIHSSYQNEHFAYPIALQEFLKINGNNSSNKLLYLHGMGAEFLTMARVSYVKIDDFRMLGNMKDVIEEKNPHAAHKLLLSKEIKYILYPSKTNSHYAKLTQLSKVTDNALLFGNPSSITTKKISLNQWWDLYIV